MKASSLVEIKLRVNGGEITTKAFPMERLLDVLRERLGLHGTKEGCGEGECGACSVLLNGELVNSCLVPALQANGANIITIEGLKNDRLKDAFLKCGGAQCGICTPGMVMAAHALLEKNNQPSEAEIKTGLAGNLCRCTGYMRIFEAVKEGAKP